MHSKFITNNIVHQAQGQVSTKNASVFLLHTLVSQNQELTDWPKDLELQATTDMISDYDSHSEVTIDSCHMYSYNGAKEVLWLIIIYTHFRNQYSFYIFTD